MGGKCCLLLPSTNFLPQPSKQEFLRIRTHRWVAPDCVPGWSVGRGGILACIEDIRAGRSNWHVMLESNTQRRRRTVRSEGELFSLLNYSKFQQCKWPWSIEESFNTHRCYPMTPIAVKQRLGTANRRSSQPVGKSEIVSITDLSSPLRAMGNAGGSSYCVERTLYLPYYCRCRDQIGDFASSHCLAQHWKSLHAR